MLNVVRAKYRQRRLAEVRVVAPYVKSLGSVARNQAAAVKTLNGQLTALAKHLGADTCGCGGACVPCRLDRVKPLVDTIMTQARRATELAGRLEGIEGVRALGRGLYDLTGDVKNLAIGDMGEANLREQLEQARRLHDEAWDRLCHPAHGIQPDHPICLQGACAAR
jgi:hypothetical protein